jgi:ATP-dependent DNA helicase RecG
LVREELGGIGVTEEATSLLDMLLERFSGSEGLELEFKAARDAIPKSIWPTISAFANTRGGWLILGVREIPESIAFEGISDPNKMIQDLTNQLRNPQKLSWPVCGIDDVSIETLAGAPLLVIRVPAAPLRARPVFIEGNPYSGTYVRRSSGDFKCTKAEVDRMMREASDITADSAVVAYHVWDAIDRDTLARYRRLCAVANPRAPRNAYDDDRFLRSIGAIGRDTTSGQEGLTVAGLLLLGLPEVVCGWRSRHLIDYRMVDADADASVRWLDREAWEGNLLEGYYAIYPRLTSSLPVPFRLEGEGRVDESRLHVVLREALVNLLVHADYSEPSASLIKRSPVGYTFRNPGSSRVAEHDLLSGDRSDPRNPVLVRMFRYAGLAEEAGTGIPSIFRAWRELGFQPPQIDVGTERYEFTIALRPVHLFSDDDVAWLGLLGLSLTEEEQLALLIAKHEGDVDNLRLRRLTGQHPSDATKTLGGLRDRQLLRMAGERRGARYPLGPLVESSATGSAAILATTESAQQGRSNGDRIIDYVRLHGRITRAEAAQLLGIGSYQASHLLRRLSEREPRFIMVGQKRGAHYVWQEELS